MAEEGWPEGAWGKAWSRDTGPVIQFGPYGPSFGPIDAMALLRMFNKAAEEGAWAVSWVDAYPSVYHVGGHITAADLAIVKALEAALGG